MHSMQDARIEQLGSSDIEAFHSVLGQVASERKYLTFLEAPPLDRIRNFVQESLAAGNVHFIARVDERLVGWCDIRRLTFASHAHRGSLGMGLLDGYRDQGLGTKLLEAALKDAWLRGFKRVELSVHADNARAIRLYEKTGFQHEGRLEAAFYDEGRYKDSLNMAILRL